MAGDDIGLQSSCFFWGRTTRPPISFGPPPYANIPGWNPVQCTWSAVFPKPQFCFRCCVWWGVCTIAHLISSALGWGGQHLTWQTNNIFEFRSSQVRFSLSPQNASIFILWHHNLNTHKNIENTGFKIVYCCHSIFYFSYLKPCNSAQLLI